MSVNLKERNSGKRRENKNKKMVRRRKDKYDGNEVMEVTGKTSDLRCPHPCQDA